MKDQGEWLRDKSNEELDTLVRLNRWFPHILVAITLIILDFGVALAYSSNNGFALKGWVLVGIAGLINIVYAVGVFKGSAKLRGEFEKRVREIKETKRGT